MEQTVQYTARVLSSLVKVFSSKEPLRQPECGVLTALKNESVSVQVAYTVSAGRGQPAHVRVHSPLGRRIRVREVLTVPSAYPAHPQTDDNYLCTAPGLYPDLLRNLGEHVRFVPGAWKALWLDVDVDSDCPAGEYPIRVEFRADSGEALCSAETKITVLDAVLPPQAFPRTEWLHGDCLADYYRVPVFSDEHWAILERFIACAVNQGVTMILTPQFTPPLDTAKGGERTTIQLVDVTVANGEYQFGFTRMKRWIDLCEKAGVRYFEMSHLFTQWGAQAAPKVMATANGEYRRLFGWDTPAVGGEYTRFLQAYLPELTARLEEWGIAERTYFHISDEPEEHQLESYRAAKESVEPLLKGYRIIDALSDYEFYRQGVVETPVCANDQIQTFLDQGVENLWAYYCTAQSLLVSNRFMAMPSARTRIFGAQLFRHNIKGCLHWGYNFYNTQNSVRTLDPYTETDSGQAFPSGDPFLVYPGEGGVPEESIRSKVMYHAMTDLRAMCLLAELTSRRHVIELLEGDLAEPITFSNYPVSDYYLLSVRNRINREIAQLSGRCR